MEANEQATDAADKPLIDLSWEECLDLFVIHDDEQFFAQDSH